VRVTSHRDCERRKRERLAPASDQSPLLVDALPPPPPPPPPPALPELPPLRHARLHLPLHELLPLSEKTLPALQLLLRAFLALSVPFQPALPRRRVTAAAAAT